MGLATAYVKQGKLDEAQSILSDAIYQAPLRLIKTHTDGEIFMTYALVNCETGHWAEAVKAFQAIRPAMGYNEPTSPIFERPFGENHPEPARMEFECEVALGIYTRGAAFRDHYAAALDSEPLNPIVNSIYADLIEAANPKAAKKHYEIAAKYGTGKLKTDAEDILYREYSESNADHVK